jgi:tRNA(fMet)-specific endonuclease VapC
MTAYSRYLLDTNIISDLIRHPRGKVAECVKNAGEENVYTSIIVACELRFGAAKRGSAKLSTQVEAIISAMEIMPLKGPADTEYANLRLYLEKMGSPIGPNDMLIAAQALAAKSVLVTANKDEFERVPNLIVQNWLI